MSVEFDWPALRGHLCETLRSLIESVPADADPMLRSQIKVTRLTFGDDPPHLALAAVKALTLDRQVADVVFRYGGNAELEIVVDLDLNAVGNTRDAVEVNRFMGMVYTECPMVTRCRVLASALRISVRVEVTRGDGLSIRFEEPPELSLAIDSNLSHLGPVWKSALARIIRIANDGFRGLPERIPIGPEK
jgi:hypothetical protein